MSGMTKRRPRLLPDAVFDRIVAMLAEDRDHAEIAAECGIGRYVVGRIASGKHPQLGAVPTKSPATLRERLNSAYTPTPEEIARKCRELRERRPRGWVGDETSNLATMGGAS